MTEGEFWLLINALLIGVVIGECVYLAIEIYRYRKTKKRFRH